MTEVQAAAPPTPPAHRLNLLATLGEATATLPAMWRGAGGILGLAALLTLARTVGADGVIGALVRGGAILATLAAWGAITRIGVAGDLDGAHRLGLGRFGFQLTRVEARLLGAGSLCALFMIIMLALLALVALAMFGFAGLDADAIRAGRWAAVGPTWKLALLTGVGLIVLSAPIVLAVRLSLFAPATVGRGQMISLQATGLTNGAIWPLLGGLIVCTVPTLACAAAGARVGGVWVPIVWIILYVGIQAPLTASFIGAAYRRLETHDMLGAWR